MSEAHPGPLARPPWKVPLIALGVVVVLFAILFGSQWQALSVQAREDIHFNHQKHVGAGINCTFCHPGTLNGRLAQIPSEVKCIGCHANVQVTGGAAAQANVDKLLEFNKQNKPLTWIRNFDLPDFVHFYHYRHIQRGVACETCHGNVAQMTVVDQSFRINMGFCISCHNQQQPRETLERLTSCLTCHG